MKILLHTCCAPCTTYTQQKLKKDGFDITCYFYNPNIHNKKEHGRRLDCLKYYTNLEKIPFKIWQGNYQIEAKKYLDSIKGYEKFPKRCRHCYILRLKETAKQAAQEKIKYFSTTLLVSPYQNQELLKEIGEYFGNKFDVKFHFDDFKKGYPKSRRISKELGLYTQKHCGCFFSMMERENARIMNHEA